MVRLKGVMMIRRVVAMVIALLMMGLQAAQADMLARMVPNYGLVGEARFKVMFFKIYDAALFAPGGTYQADAPYALRLTYLINAKKDRIVDQTVKEMRRMKASSEAQIEAWIPVMEQAFISMPKGSYADFIHTPDGRLTLAAKGKRISVIEDTALAQAIMDIWLGPKVRDRRFQDRLMGRKK